MDGRFGLIEKDLKMAVAGCDICGDEHYTEDCDKAPWNEEVDYEIIGPHWELHGKEEIKEVDSEDEEDEQVDEEIVLEPNQAVKPPAVPLTSGMPNYAKFIKDLITDKRKLRLLFLNAECSVIVQNQIPPKLEEPGSFLITCSLDAKLTCDALADIGASIILMPFSVYRRLSLAALKPTRMSIRFADHSFQYPMGIAENLCVKVGHIVFLADFVILEMEEDAKVPLILGRPFLYTADAIIRVKDKIISIDVIDKDEALEMELMNFLDTDEGEALLACSEEEQVMVADMVKEILELSTDESTPEDETFEEIERDGLKIETSVDNPPTDLELKPLPVHLEYAFLEGKSLLPVVISSSLSDDEKGRLMTMLKAHKRAFA
uniref:uncharacterized protein LOC122604376 n=1 Tax=Erigeron canadensis TaxID=72917 RepID=UPI001CB9CF40|nr:uncharacterized protein LOC122604376 [Erigeron canadensis]